MSGNLLAKWIIGKAEKSEAYRAGTLTGMKHPKPDEEMKYREDTLYLFCHGFYSPKERIFLKRLMEVAEGEIQYFHWGDMDMGGIRIFRFNKKNIFPKLKPYKMDREAFQEALERGAGIPLEEKKKEKLEKLNAGELEELKKCILEKGVEIEQEILLAENAIAEN